MRVKVAKWGNSLAVRLPKRYADELGLEPGSEVDLEKAGSRLAIETAPARRIPHYRLEDLLAKIAPGQAPPPFEDWGILPSEWPEEDWSDIAPTDTEWEAWKREEEERRGRRRRA
ncbi:MAG: AbrB/MazE/SpoVT family DNA-binding domain-containing protein [Bauldia sp.]